MTKLNNARPQADTAAHAEQRDRAARMRDTSGRFTKIRDGAPSAPVPAALPSTQEASPRGTVPVSADTPDNAYALEVTGDSLGMHADVGAALIVAPEMPTGAGLAVFYLKDSPGPVVLDLTHGFHPEFAKPPVPGSEIVPMIEVVQPGTGRLGYLTAERVEKIHRVVGVYSAVDLPSKYGLRLPKLPVMSECPEGMGEHYADDACAYPLVRNGETVVYDPSLRELTHGALCVMQWNNGNRDVMLTNFRQVGGQGAERWWADPVNRPGIGTRYTNDGPYDAEHLREKIVGTVVGVLVPQRAGEPVHEPEAETASELTDAAEATEDSDDTELRGLGRLFEEARARERTACNAANQADDVAEQRRPARPACLTYRSADHGLSVYRWHTHPEALEGVEIHSDDVDWLRRKMPMMHEVLRPTSQGERAHMDHPGKRFDIQPHPEAQARAEEIVTAYDAWRAEIERIRAEHIAPEIEAEAEEAGGITLRLAEQIAGIPAHTAAGLRVKLRALCHYDPASWMRTGLPELPDPDQRLYFSLRQDIEREAEADASEPVTIETAAPLHFDAYAFEIALRSPQKWADEFAHHAIGMHVADKILRMSKPELVAFVAGAAERSDGAAEAMHKALSFAQEALEGWGRLLGVAAIRYLVAASAMTVEHEARQAESGEI